MIINFIRIKLILFLSVISFCCYSSDIYQTIDNNGHVTFSSVVPQNARIIKIVKVKNLIKKISVIKGASAQNIKIKKITKKLVKTRIQRNKKRNKISESYVNEIVEIRNQRQIELQNLNSDNTNLRKRLTNNQKIKQFIQRKHAQQSKLN